MVVGKKRPSRLIIDRSAIYQNVKKALENLNNTTELFMVVKANGYGHGAVETAKEAIKAGATGLCVAILDEALELRDTGITVPILVLGITESKYASLMAANKISATVSDIEWLQESRSVLLSSKVKDPLHVHLALDTGMGRIGIQDSNCLKNAVTLITQDPNFDFEGIFTHFATADIADIDGHTYFEEQLSRWNDFMAILKIRPRYVHVSNSATSMWHTICNSNMIRYGVAGYGLNPSGDELILPYKLYHAMSLMSKLVYVKKIIAGRSVGYGATYTAIKDEWIGTLPIGYADGYERQLQGFHVLVDGQLCEIVGRICMDQMMIRLPRKYPVGTDVTMIGTDHGKHISLQDMATYCGTIHYEIACGFADRLPREYRN